MNKQKSIAIVDGMISRLRLADALMRYTPEMIRLCMVAVVEASTDVEFPRSNIASAQGLAEVAYMAGLRDYPLDLIAEEFKKHIKKATNSKDFLRVHQLAGLMTIRLATTLSVLEGGS